MLTMLDDDPCFGHSGQHKWSAMGRSAPSEPARTRTWGDGGINASSVSAPHGSPTFDAERAVLGLPRRYVGAHYDSRAGCPGVDEMHGSGNTSVGQQRLPWPRTTG